MWVVAQLADFAETSDTAAYRTDVADHTVVLGLSRTAVAERRRHAAHIGVRGSAAVRTLDDAARTDTAEHRKTRTLAFAWKDIRCARGTIGDGGWTWEAQYPVSIAEDELTAGKVDTVVGTAGFVVAASGKTADAVTGRAVDVAVVAHRLQCQGKPTRSILKKKRVDLLW